MSTTLQERYQISTRMLYFYHCVLVDIRLCMHEGEYKIALDAADLFESMTLDFFHAWKSKEYEEIINEIHRIIDSFAKRHGMQRGMQSRYYEIFNLPYNAFIEKYLPDL